jgi:adenylate kinase family enzyme
MAMRRVVVLGVSCSGKSTLARALADRLAVPYIELDALHFGPRWEEVPAELFQERVRTALDADPDGWVVDGNYFGKLGHLVLEHADTAVLVDLPFRVVLPRAFRRTALRLVLGTEMWNGNRERLRNVLSRDSIPLWVIRTHRSFRAKWEARLSEHPRLSVVRLHSSREISTWIQSVER